MNEAEAIDDEGRRIKKRAAVFVEEAQRPMAIGKKGQNIRLATDLTGFELDMYNYEELPAFKAKLAELTGKEVKVEEIVHEEEDDSDRAATGGGVKKAGMTAVNKKETADKDAEDSKDAEEAPAETPEPEDKSEEKKDAA